MTDKRPDNFLHIGLIKALFPKAKIINTLRDRDDILISIYSNLFGSAVPYAYAISDIRHWQAQHDRLMHHWHTRWPDDILRLDYEALAASPKPVINEMLAFCGLDWEDECLAPQDHAGHVRTLSQWQVRGAIHTGSVGRAEPFRRWLR